MSQRPTHFDGLSADSRSVTVSVPGRVNLIGEHIDYNGGTVLPSALPLALMVALRPRDDEKINLHAGDSDEIVARSTRDQPVGHWSDHSVGAVLEAQQLGLLRGGADIAIRSTVPQGAGLSSSAALIVAILKATRAAAGSDTLADVDIAVAARRVENDFIGVPCGIMDQMAVAIAKPGQAIALDTVSLDYKVIDLLPAHAFVVVHSGVSRKLSDGRYKARKLECDAAALALGAEALCAVTLDTLDAAQGLNDTLRARARHCITEHQRVLATVRAIRSQDVGAIGALMNESHASMRDDFQMSVPEIDRLVETAIGAGAAGARLTGGGFGGCIVALLENDAIDEWRKALIARHPKAWFVSAVQAASSS